MVIWTLEHGDQVLADKGFLIAEEFANRNGTLNDNTILHPGRSQLSAKEVKTTQKISHMRIQVERAIEKVKNVNILCTNMSTVCIWFPMLTVL